MCSVSSSSSIARSCSVISLSLLVSLLIVRIGDSMQAFLWLGASRVSVVGLPYLCGSCPLLGSGKFLYVFRDWLLICLNTFPAVSELLFHFSNTGVFVRL